MIVANPRFIKWYEVQSDMIPRATVAAALNALRAEWLGEQIAEPQSAEESSINARIQNYADDLDAVMIALGLSNTDTKSRGKLLVAL